MSAVDLALPRLQTEEGFRTLSYLDSEGKQTIGYGFNITAGITKFAATALLTAQVTELHKQLTGIAWYVVLDPPRQSVCLDIAFNGGIHDLLNYPRMIAALEVKNWQEAANQCQVSTPGLQARYAILARILLTGIPA